MKELICFNDVFQQCASMMMMNDDALVMIMLSLGTDIYNENVSSLEEDNNFRKLSGEGLI